MSILTNLLILFLVLDAIQYFQLFVLNWWFETNQPSFIRFEFDQMTFHHLMFHSSMNMGPTWWIACGSVGQSSWRTGSLWSACCWMSLRQGKRVKIHSLRQLLAQMFSSGMRNRNLSEKTYMYFFLLFFSFSISFSSGTQLFFSLHCH